MKTMLLFFLMSCSGLRATPLSNILQGDANLWLPDEFSDCTWEVDSDSVKKLPTLYIGANRALVLSYNEYTFSPMLFDSKQSIVKELPSVTGEYNDQFRAWDATRTDFEGFFVLKKGKYFRGTLFNAKQEVVWKKKFNWLGYKTVTVDYDQSTGTATAYRKSWTGNWTKVQFYPNESKPEISECEPRTDNEATYKPQDIGLQVVAESENFELLCDGLWRVHSSECTLRAKSTRESLEKVEPNIFIPGMSSSKIGLIEASFNQVVITHKNTIGPAQHRLHHGTMFHVMQNGKFIASLDFLPKGLKAGSKVDENTKENLEEEDWWLPSLGIDLPIVSKGGLYLNEHTFVIKQGKHINVVNLKNKTYEQFLCPSEIYAIFRHDTKECLYFVCKKHIVTFDHEGMKAHQVYSNRSPSNFSNHTNKTAFRATSSHCAGTTWNDEVFIFHSGVLTRLKEFKEVSSKTVSHTYANSDKLSVIWENHKGCVFKSQIGSVSHQWTWVNGSVDRVFQTTVPESYVTKVLGNTYSKRS